MRWWKLALFVGAFAVGSTEFIVVGLLPQIAADTGVTEAAAGQLVSVNAVAFAVGVPVLAAAFARVDRRRVLIGSLAVFVAAHLMAATAPDFTVLLASRVLTGASFGLYIATALAVAARLAGPANRAAAMATVVSGVTTATALGVPASTLLGQHAGWRVPLAAIAALAVVGLALVLFTVPTLGADNGPPLRERSTALLARPVLVGLAAVALFWAASFTAYTYLVPMLENRAGVHGGLVTVVLFIAGLGAVCGNVLGGRGADRWPRATVLVTAAITTASLFALLPAFRTPAGAIVLVAVWQIAAWSFVPAAQAALYSAGGQAGDLVVSFVVSGFNIGIVVGAGLGGVALDGAGLPGVGFLAAGLAVISLVLVAAMARMWPATEVGARAETAPAAVTPAQSENCTS
ncbi:MFS transporter [Pseudonocardia sp. CA-142604]|uniref:MFS transporter n=1 Tax=Pseudonocardia sp. CA-142604 TaxID=3240024 RepID=UPI003D94FA4F